MVEDWVRYGGYWEGDFRKVGYFQNSVCIGVDPGAFIDVFAVLVQRGEAWKGPRIVLPKRWSRRKRKLIRAKLENRRRSPLLCDKQSDLDSGLCSLPSEAS